MEEIDDGNPSTSQRRASKRGPSRPPRQRKGASPSQPPSQPTSRPATKQLARLALEAQAQTGTQLTSPSQLKNVPVIDLTVADSAGASVGHLGSVSEAGGLLDVSAGQQGSVGQAVPQLFRRGLDAAMPPPDTMEAPEVRLTGP